MKNYLCVALIASLPLLSSCSKSGESSATKNFRQLDTTKIAQEYANWLSSQFPKDYSNTSAGDIHIDTLSTTTYQFSGLSQTFILHRLRATSQKKNLRSDFPRLIGIAEDSSGNQSVFFDTGFFMPECGENSDANISFGEIDRIQLNKKQVLVVEKIERPIVCPGIPTQEKRKTIIFLATAPYNKVLEVDSGYVNFHDDYDFKQTKSTEFSHSMVFANSCIDFDTKDCHFLTVLNPPRITSYQWNQEMSQLIPIK